MAYHGHTPNFQSKEQYEKWKAQQEQETAKQEEPKQETTTPEETKPETPKNDGAISLGGYHRNPDGSYTNTNTGETHKKPTETETGKSDLPGLGLEIKDGKLEDKGWENPIKPQDLTGSGDNNHITVRPGKGTTTQVVPNEVTNNNNNSGPTTTVAPVNPSKPTTTPTTTTPNTEKPQAPTVDVLEPDEVYIPPKPTVAPQTYLTDEQKKEAFNYETRKKYNLDWDSTKITQHPSGAYIIKDGKGNTYITKGEGEGMVLDLQFDGRDLDGDGNVSYGEKLAEPFMGIYYGGKELVEGAKSLFTNPSDKLQKWAADAKETANMWAGGADKQGLTRTGEVADRNGDGEISGGERFVNIVGDIKGNVVDGIKNIGDNIAGFNDNVINGQVKVLKQLMKWGGYTEEQIANTEEGMKLALGFTNGIIGTALNPIFGVPHLISGIADYAKSDTGKAAIKKNSEMKQAIYGTTPTTNTPPTTTVEPEVIAPTVEEVAEEVAVNFNPLYVKGKDADKMAMDAMARQKMEENGEDDRLNEFNKLDQMAADFEVEKQRKQEKAKEDEKIAYETSLKNWQTELDTLNQAEEDELGEVGLDIGLLPHLRNNRTREEIREKYARQRKEIEARKPVPSDALLKTYVLRGIVNNEDHDPLKRIIQMKILRSMF